MPTEDDDMPAPMPAEAKLRVARKVQHLIKREKTDPKQAFAMAMSMEKSGRLTEEGEYKRVPKKRKQEGGMIEGDDNEGAA
jgi:hypothetical protein